MNDVQEKNKASGLTEAYIIPWTYVVIVFFRYPLNVHDFFCFLFFYNADPSIKADLFKEDSGESSSLNQLAVFWSNMSGLVALIWTPSGFVSPGGQTGIPVPGIFRY